MTVQNSPSVEAGSNKHAVPVPTPPKTRCHYRLPNPETAGYTTVEALRAAAARSPDLRPCPLHRGSRGTWYWVYRTLCEKCPNRRDNGQ